jgi:hypothetical protein
MKRLLLILILIVFQLIAFTVCLNAKQHDKRALTSKVMELSGMNDQIRQIPAFVQIGVSSRKGSTPPDLYNILEPEIVKAFQPEKILKGISREIENKLNLRTLQDVLTWLESPLGQKITAIEVSNSTPEALQGMKEFAALMQKTPPPKKRSDLVKRFNRATKPAEWIVEIQISSILALTTAMNSSLPKEKRANPAEIRKKIEQLRPKAQKEAESNSVMGSLYAYRTLTDEEFQRYVVFAESTSAKRFHHVFLNALKNEMQMVCLKIGKSLGEKIEKLPLEQEVTVSGKIVVHLKDGRTLVWDNCTEKSDRYCTFIAGGELCISKRDVASVGRN